MQLSVSQAAALEAWRQLLGAQAVAIAPDPVPGTAPPQHLPLAVLQPQTAEAVQALVQIAARHGIPLYPVSTGRNWGYGDAFPTAAGCVVVQLAALDRILAVDAELGVVTLEPGVTQGQLARFFAEHDLPFMVPVTGAGPQGSLVGNALERGFGIAPYVDHFLAVTSLEAVLPDGSLYRSALSGAGAEVADRVHKWGVGPYLDGLFSQSGFGVVTQMTLALARKPEQLEAVFFRVKRDEDLERVLTAARGALREVGAHLNGFKLLNQRQLLAYGVPYPFERVAAGGVMDDALLAELGRTFESAAWLGSACLYGTPRTVAAARHALRRALKPHVDELRFVRPAMLQKLARVLPYIPGRAAARAATVVAKLVRNLGLMAGQPDELALSLAYWRAGGTPPATDADPARDGRGLIWYAPLIPFKPALIRAAVDQITRICSAHGLEPLITLTSHSERLVCATVPLLFERADEAACQRAAACFDALFAAGQAIGVLPYRLPARAMGALVDPQQPFWRLAAKLERAIDPQGILAPGRYNATAGRDA